MDIDQHLRTLGIGNIVYSLLLLIPAGLVFGILTSVGYLVEDQEASRILPFIGTGVGIFLALLSIPGFIAGWGLLKKKSWGMPLALVVGILNILCFPLGTALGGYSIWIFSKINKSSSSPPPQHA